MEVRELALGLLLVFASYFGAGALGGAGFWLVQPLRRTILGWVLTGMLLAVVAYGIIGLSAILGYIYLGVNVIGYESVNEAWQSLLWITGVTAIVGGIAGAYYWWKDGRVRDQPCA